MITPELKDKVLNNLLSHNDVTYTFVFITIEQPKLIRNIRV